MKIHYLTFFYLTLVAIFLNEELIAAQESKYEELPIVIIIPSYNNEQWYQKNLESALNQNYSNYSVIYIDDCSLDGTAELVAKYLAEFDKDSRVKLICNQERKGAIYNLWETIHSCSPATIIVTLDGDDWLPNQDTLSRINKEYLTKGIWMTWGQLIHDPSGAIGWCHAFPKHIVEKRAYREYPWIMSHLRTFYAGLFQEIKLEDLMYEDQFMDVTWDQAMMFPMVEMAEERSSFISDITYVYNMSNPISDFRAKQNRSRQIQDYIIAKESYHRASTLQIFKKELSVLDIVIFTQKNIKKKPIEGEGYNIHYALQ